jgi:FRG domain
VPDVSIALLESFQTNRELFSIHGFPTVEFYRYMVYLRHHGFPSPLLDWTASQNIAAFFAFREKGEQARSVYVYCERPHSFKGGAVGEPEMRALGPYVRSHRRHFRQRSNYTICADFNSEFGGWRFHPHDPVFGNRGRQDFLWKFDFPSSERIEVLRRLDEYNLNAYSLYDTEETLLETMWAREHDLKNLG